MAVRYEIRKSDTQDFHILISIDEHNNEKLIKQSDSLEELQALQKGKDAPVVNEEDTRGTIEPPKE